MSREFINGFDAATGQPLPPAMDVEDMLRDPRDARLDPDTYEEYLWWLENHSDPERGPAAHVDPGELASAGWAVIFGPDVDDDVKKKLNPLLQWREEQAAGHYKTFQYHGERKQDFLEARGASWGPADPKNLPYYILLVGGPEGIPFDFQYDLDVQYAVGRIHFDTANDYAIYANHVVAAEKADDVLPQQLTFFGIDIEGDETSQQLMEELVHPLKNAVAERVNDDLEVVFENGGTKAHLRALMRKADDQAFLFAATHGMRFRANDDRQLDHQGALVCSDGSGRSEGGIPRESYFTGDDVPDELLHGLVACLFGCFTAGSPGYDNFSADAVAKPRVVAPAPFISKLSRTLLLRGALAVLGHIDRMWTSSFTWSTAGDQTRVFESMLYKMIEGYPVGRATEFVNQQYAELSTKVAKYYIDREDDIEPDLTKVELMRLRKASLDSRNFVVIGDPAVCLKGTRTKR